MKTIILYGSKYGTTEQCAAELAKRLSHEAEVKKITGQMRISWDEYSRVIIGGPVYIGRLRKEVTEFLKQNEKELLSKKLGLFICCMAKDDEAQEQLKKNVPPTLYAHATAMGVFGGAFLLSRMNLIDRTIAKKVAKINADTADIRYEEMDRFVAQFETR